ncbi:MAG: hypothetical protein HFF36_03830 [Coprobacillus sp.]|nr:hypothetical protein [Coprobacillus sp.]
MNNDIKRYLKEVKIIIPLNSKEKQEFILMLENRIKEAKLTTYQQVVDELGNPNELASSFIDDIDTNTLIKSIKKTNIIRRAAIAVILIVLSCTLVVTSYRLYNLNKLYDEVRQQQPVEVETTIE